MRFFCVRREVAGRTETVRLIPGHNHVGSLSSNHIVLAESGISRHHAVLEVDGSSVTLEDLASKNGTFVNGSPVRRLEVHAGDTLAFGSWCFVLAELEADEAELAIELAPGRDRSDPTPDPPRETTLVSTGTGSPEFAAAMAAVAVIVRRLCHRDGADLGSALTILCRTLGASAAWVLERSNAGPAVSLATHGASDDATEAVAERFLTETAAPEPQPTRILRPSADLQATGAVLIDPAAPALGIWVSGAKPGEGVEELLRAMLYLIDRARDRWTAQKADLPHRIPAHEPGDLTMPEGYVPGTSEAMAVLYDQMASLMQGDLPVLILGETGVGKEYLAHIVHASSSRRNEAFVALNCAAIPTDLLEAELFGIEAGAATGVTARTGTFQRAHQGTLFLDEIGDMSVGLQAKLLRALQEQEIRPVGGRGRAVDVRVVAATNIDLEARIGAGTFRADLYYRLAGCTLVVPPLRDRDGDLAALVEHFIASHAGEIGKPIRGMTVKALQLLMSYAWPGNVRELEHEVRRLVYMCRAGQPIDASMLSPRIHRAGDSVALPDGETEAGASARDQDRLATERVATIATERVATIATERVATVATERLNLARLEKQAILRALDQAGGKRVEAARLLGISRDALRRRIARHALEPRR